MNSVRNDSIKKLSGYLDYIFSFLLLMIPSALVAQWLLLEWPPFNQLILQGIFFKTVETPEGVINLATVPWTPLSKMLGFLSSALGAVPFIAGLYLLKSLFGNYKKGEIFTLANACYYKKLGSLFLLNGLCIEPLSQALKVVAVTLTNPPGHRYITLSFGTPNVEAVVCGVVIILISWIMIEATTVHDENHLII